MNQDDKYRSRVSLISRILSRKSRNHDDLFEFCIMMFNSNKEKYQDIKDQEKAVEDTYNYTALVDEKVEKSKTWIWLLWLAWLVNFIMCVMIIGVLRK